MRLLSALPILALAVQVGAQPLPDETAVRNITPHTTPAGFSQGERRMEDRVLSQCRCEAGNPDP